MKRLLALPIVALLSTASCSQLSQVKDLLAPYTPKMSFDKLALNSIDFSKIDVDFTFNVANPTPSASSSTNSATPLALKALKSSRAPTLTASHLSPKAIRSWPSLSA